MTYDLLLALTLFALVSSITPGPNNMMLMASGANFGIRRTLPHMMGVGLGFVFMIVLVGLGIAGLFELFPVLYGVLQIVSVLYLLWLAWKIASAAPRLDKGQAGGTPMNFWQAAAFQWVNPKAWTMSLAAITLYAPEGSGIWGVLLVSLVFGIVNMPSISLWVGLGVQMRRFLNTPGRLRTFNIIMGLALVASLYPILGIGKAA